MKRVILVVVLMLFASLAFAEYVEDMDGHDWHLWSGEHKIGYIQGFYSAYSSIWERFRHELGSSMTSEDEDRMEEMFFIRVTVGDMIDRLDEFYSSYKNRNYTIYSTLMWIAGKDYWSE
jgi:hypothetical protein